MEVPSLACGSGRRRDDRNYFEAAAYHSHTTALAWSVSIPRRSRNCKPPRGRCHQKTIGVLPSDTRPTNGRRASCLLGISPQHLLQTTFCELEKPAKRGRLPVTRK